MNAKPERCLIRSDKDHLTYARPDEPHYVRYRVVGTLYGCLYNTSGDVRFWKSYSGAYKAAIKYNLRGH